MKSRALLFIIAIDLLIDAMRATVDAHQQWLATYATDGQTIAWDDARMRQLLAAEFGQRADYRGLSDDNLYA